MKDKSFKHVLCPSAQKHSGDFAVQNQPQFREKGSFRTAKAMVIKMEQNKLERINQLARKAKAEGLSEAEALEQQQLRSDYIAAYRESLRAQLDNIVLVEPDGTKTKIVPKSKKK